MSEWKEYKLKDITTKIGSGATPTGGGNAYKHSGISLIRSQNILDLNFSFDGLAFIDEVQAWNLRNVIVEDNDILLNITGDSVARVCKVPNIVLPARVNQHVSIIRVEKHKVNSDFLLYYLQSIKEFLLVYSEIGGTRNALTKAMIENLSVSLPSLPEQTAIAEVLSSLDDKIDLLHRQNKTLEQLAETLFRQWFVEEAEEGWEVGTLESVCDKISSGGTPSTKVGGFYNGDINWYSTKELNDGFLFESTSKITNEGLQNSSAKIFPEDSVVIAIYAAPTVGRLGILANEATFNQAACGFIANNQKICHEYLYLHLFSSRRQLNDMASGSAQQNLNVSIMKEFEILVPPKELMDKFRNQVRPIFQKIKSNTHQIRTLTHLRDTLLPKLMNGEIRLNQDFQDEQMKRIQNVENLPANP
jgi:type I restriction enzyme S subunit